jgi:ATP-binding cassette subfamily F protein uup
VTYPGNYDQYLLDKEEALRVEELQNAEFDRKLAQEECGSVRDQSASYP